MHPNLSPEIAQTLLQFAPDALVLVDGAGTIVYANEAVSDVFGYRPDELIGQPLACLVPERFHDSHRRYVEGFAKQPMRRAMRQRGVPLFARRRDGSEFPASISLGPVHIDGQLHVAAAARDITEAQRMAEELRRARDEADKANRAKSLFLATASHDLRQPLQALQLLNSGLKRRHDDPVSAQLIEQQQQAINSMTELLNAVLDIGKLESGTVEPHIVEVPMPQVCAELRSQFEPLANAKGLTLDIESCNDSLQTDRVLLVRLLQNLLANAVKYTTHGGVSMRCVHADGQLHIEVADTGAGIPADRLPNVFEAYYQLDHQHRGQGLGLGLAIVKRIAALLGYGLAVQSQPGAGTRFRISIPEAFVVTRRAGAKPAPRLQRATHTQRYRILVVEDDPQVRDAMLLFLQSEGFEAIGSACAREVEALFRRDPKSIHLVISDYHLGEETSGGNIVESLRALVGPHLPVIFLSGDTSLTLRSLQDLPRTRVLNKPVDVDKLTQAIAKLLDLE